MYARVRMYAGGVGSGHRGTYVRVMCSLGVGTDRLVGVLRF
jgi:hypothetical protein